VIERVDFGENDQAVLVDDEGSPFADAGEGRALAKDSEGTSYCAVRIEIGTGRDANRSELFLEPRGVAGERVNADVQNLGIERGELLQSGVEHRQLGGSSRRPVERVKGDHDILLATKVAELNANLAVAVNGGKVEVGGEISYLQGHGILLALRMNPEGYQYKAL